MFEGFLQNSNDLVENKMIDKMNEVVKAMTRQMADRLETKKSLRLMDK
jgi:hypothetical protein